MSEVHDDDDLGLAAGSETTATEEAKGISLLRKAEQSRSSRTNTLYLDVPSWAGDLIAAYRVVDRPRLEQMVRKIQQEAKHGNDSSARTAADIDLILEANVGLYMYDPEGGDSPDDRRVPIEDDLGVTPFNRFAEILRRIRPEDRSGKPAPNLSSARSVVLYAMEDNAVAISAHALMIARWMRDPSKDPTMEEGAA